MRVPAEIYDLIVFQFEDAHEWEETRNIRKVEKYEPDVIKRLSTLRLVNKTFSRSASPRLFRRVKLNTTCCYDPDYQPMAKLWAISESQYGAFVRQVEICLRAWWICGSQKAIDFTKDLGICLSQLPNLEVFEATGLHLTHCFGTHQSMSIPKTISDAMASVGLFRLRDISISFNYSHEYENFFNKSHPGGKRIEDFLRPLRHLRILVAVCLARDRWGPADEALTAPFFRFIEAAENLETLDIHCREDIIMDKLKTSHLTKLRTLRLEYVRISSHRIISLLEVCKETITRVSFFAVCLCAGSWLDIFTMMCHLPCLNWVEVFHNICAPSEEGYNFIPGINNIYTNDWLDVHALVDLRRMVNSRRKAQQLPLIPSFGHTVLKPLEEVCNDKYQAGRRILDQGS